MIPKIHYSSPSTDFNTKTEKEKGAAGREVSVKKLRTPLLKALVDFINPLEFVLFWEAVGGNSLQPFDIMLEAKAKDVALLRLRRELERQQESRFRFAASAKKSEDEKVTDANELGHNMI